MSSTFRVKSSASYYPATDIFFLRTPRLAKPLLYAVYVCVEGKDRLVSLATCDLTLDCATKCFVNSKDASLINVGVFYNVPRSLEGPSLTQTERITLPIESNDRMMSYRR